MCMKVKQRREAAQLGPLEWIAGMGVDGRRTDGKVGAVEGGNERDQNWLRS